jgi:hypothetical protein
VSEKLFGYIDEVVVSYWRHCPFIYKERLRNTKKRVKIFAVQGDIRTQNLQNSNQKRCG